MEQPVDRPTLNDILVQAAQLSHEERRARIKRCVAQHRHKPDQVPICVAPPEFNRGLDIAISAGA